MDCSPPGSSVHRNSSGKNSGVGCHALLQEIFPTQGSNPGLPHCRQILYCLSHQGRNSLGMCICVTRTRPVSWPGCGQEPTGCGLDALIIIRLTYFHLKDIAWNILKGKLKTWIISNPEILAINMGYVLYFQYYFHIYGFIKIGCIFLRLVVCQLLHSFAIIFSHSEGCLFTLQIISFVVQKLLSLIRSHLFIFAFISNILGGGS